MTTTSVFSSGPRADAPGAREMVIATGTYSRPFVPTYRGAANHRGHHLHSAGYQGASDFEGQRVVVVGGAN